MIDLVALDADDTLWHNEPLYRAARDRFCALPGDGYAPAAIDDRLYETERRNLEHFGYGVKGFVLSMIETGIDLTGGRLSGSDIRSIIDWGREMLASPVELLDGAREAVEDLAGAFPLILVHVRAFPSPASGEGGGSIGSSGSGIPLSIAARRS